MLVIGRTGSSLIARCALSVAHGHLQATIKKPPLTHIKSSNMTQDLNQQNELKRKELCESCAGIQRNWRRAPGHAELVQGLNRKEPRSHGQVTITQYRCERCGTEWEYENNKVNLHAGWSVVGQ